MSKARRDRARPVIVEFPPLRENNPYRQRARAAVEAAGARYWEPDFKLRPSTVRRILRGADAVHLHWLEFLLMAPPAEGSRQALVAFGRLARLVSALLALRVAGVRILWTVHNRRPHGPHHRTVWRVGSVLLGRLAHVSFVHTRRGAALAHRELKIPASKLVVVPQGFYAGDYPRDPRSREELRSHMGFGDDDLVLLAFGIIRPYKRLPDLVRTVRASSSDRIRLIVAGKPVAEDAAAELEAAAGDDPRVTLLLEEVPAEAVEGLHRAADATILNYEDISSSAALHLAVSLGLPAVALEGAGAEETLEADALITFGPGRLREALDTLDLAALDRARRALDRTGHDDGWAELGRLVARHASA